MVGSELVAEKSDAMAIGQAEVGQTIECATANPDLGGLRVQAARIELRTGDRFHAKRGLLALALVGKGVSPVRPAANACRWAA